LQKRRRLRKIGRRRGRQLLPEYGVTDPNYHSAESSRPAMTCDKVAGFARDVHGRRIISSICANLVFDLREPRAAAGTAFREPGPVTGW
jgi:hypothetical protein